MKPRCTTHGCIVHALCIKLLRWSALITVLQIVTGFTPNSPSCLVLTAIRQHCSTCRSPGVETVSHSATTGTATLASGQTANWLQTKPAVLTYKIHSTSTPIPRQQPPHKTSKARRQLRSSSMPLLHRPSTRTRFADGAFCYDGISVWNSLNSYIVDLDSVSLAVFKSRLNTFLFRQTLLRVSVYDC